MRRCTLNTKTVRGLLGITVLGLMISSTTGCRDRGGYGYSDASYSSFGFDFLPGFGDYYEETYYDDSYYVDDGYDYYEETYYDDYYDDGYYDDGYYDDGYYEDEYYEEEWDDKSKNSD